MCNHSDTMPYGYDTINPGHPGFRKRIHGFLKDSFVIFLTVKRPAALSLGIQEVLFSGS